MARITNRSQGPLEFIVKGEAKDGVPLTQDIAPGETKDIDAIEDASYRGRVASGAITVEPTRARASSPKE